MSKKNKIFYKINPSQYSTIINLYKSGKNANQIAKLYSVKRVTILRILRKNNILIIRHPTEKCFSEKIINKITKEYNNKKKIKDISKSFNIPRWSILKILKNKNIPIRDNNSEQRKYKLNENYFDDINNEFKAYFLGLLFADGCNTGKNIKITLVESDKDILEKMVKEIYLTQKPLRFLNLNSKNKKHNNVYELTICCSRIKNKLEEYGIILCKSLILEYPIKTISKNLFCHFLRGYFDGDGCVSLCKTKHRINFSITGTPNFLEEIKKRIEICINHKIINRIYNTNSKYVKEIKISKKSTVKKINDLMYQDANIFMKRKKEKFDVFFEKERLLCEN